MAAKRLDRSNLLADRPDRRRELQYHPERAGCWVAIKTGLGMQDLTYGGSSGTPGVGGGLDGVADLGFYNTLNPSTMSQAQYNGRLDAYVTQKDHVSFTIYWVPSYHRPIYNGPVRAANFWHHSQVNDAFSVVWNHVFSPTLLNQARANAAGWRWNEVTTNPQAPFGLPQDQIMDNYRLRQPSILWPAGSQQLEPVDLRLQRHSDEDAWAARTSRSAAN